MVLPQADKEKLAVMFDYYGMLNSAIDLRDYQKWIAESDQNAAEEIAAKAPELLAKLSVEIVQLTQQRDNLSTQIAAREEAKLTLES